MNFLTKLKNKFRRGKNQPSEGDPLLEMEGSENPSESESPPTAPAKPRFSLKFPAFSFFKKKDLTAIDIGSHSIKIAQLKKTGNQWSLQSYDVLTIGMENPEQGPEERKQAAATALKDYFQQHPALPKDVVASVSGNAVIVRYVKFPSLSHEDLAKSIQFEAEPYIPFDIRDVNIGFHILGDVVEEGQKKMETILVAAKKDIIQNRLDVLQGAGLRPAIIDVDAFALENAYEANRGNSSETVILINIGANVTNMTILENGISKVVRDVFVSGSALTKAIQRNFQCDTKTAETLKAKHKLLFSAEEKEQMLSDDNKEALQVSTVMFPVIRDLLGEIHRSLDFYLAQGTERAITKALLCGGSASLKNLDKYFSQELKIPVEIFDPFEQISGAEDIPADLRPALAIAVGLATRREGDSK